VVDWGKNEKYKNTTPCLPSRWLTSLEMTQRSLSYVHMLLSIFSVEISRPSSSTFTFFSLTSPATSQEYNILVLLDCNAPKPFATLLICSQLLLHTYCSTARYLRVPERAQAYAETRELRLKDRSCDLQQWPWAAEGPDTFRNPHVFFKP